MSRIDNFHIFLNVSAQQSGYGPQGTRKRVLYFFAKRPNFFRFFSAIRWRRLFSTPGEDFHVGRKIQMKVQWHFIPVRIRICAHR
jgi:hypothetical protein